MNGVMIVPKRRIQGIGILRHRAGLGQGFEADDLKLLSAMSTDDLVVMGRMVSATVQIISQKMGGLIGILGSTFASVDSVQTALSFLGIAPDPSTLDAIRLRGDVVKASSDASGLVTSNFNSLMAGVSMIILSREPGWQMSYTQYSDPPTINVIAGRSPDDLKNVSLDFQGDLVSCVGYLYKNRDLIDRAKKASASSLSGLGITGFVLGMLILIGIIIASIVAFSIAETHSKQAELAKLSEAKRKIVEAKAVNSSQIDLLRQQQAPLLQVAPESRTPDDVAKITDFDTKIAALDAANRGLSAKEAVVDKAIADVEASKDWVERIAEIVETGVKYLIYGGAGVLLLGIVWAIWRPFG